MAAYQISSKSMRNLLENECKIFCFLFFLLPSTNDTVIRMKQYSSIVSVNIYLKSRNDYVNPFFVDEIT